MKKHLRKFERLALLAGFPLLVTLAPTESYADDVWGFTLVNSSTNADLRDLGNDETIDLSTTGHQLNIRANTSSETVDWVVFELDGNDNLRTEGMAPYALAGDTEGDYFDWTPSIGTHTLKATPYNSWGDAGTPLTITFTVVEQAQPEPQPQPQPQPVPYCSADYEEQNGVVIAEIENLPLSDGWQVRTDAGGYTGNGYAEWVYSDNLSSPGIGFIETTIKINQAGKYRFFWYNKVGKGDNSTEHNDSWLKFPDASDFYGEGSHRVYPHGSDKWPNPEGAGADGWFKVFSSESLDWSWSTLTSDHNDLAIVAEFATPGVYKLQISARSDGHLLDRFALVHESVSTDWALQLSNSETRCTQSSARRAAPAVTGSPFENNPVITVYPNPTASDITVSGLSVQSADLEVSLTNGITTYRPAFRVVGQDKVQVALGNSNVRAGYYMLRLKHGGKDYFQKVLVK